jgi:hypothetical protein
MTSVLKKAGLAVALGATALTVAAPAQAQRYRHYGHGDVAGAALVGGLAGLAVGAAVADRGYPVGYYADPYYAYPPAYYYGPGYGYYYYPHYRYYGRPGYYGYHGGYRGGYRGGYHGGYHHR